MLRPPQPTTLARAAARLRRRPSQRQDGIAAVPAAAAEAPAAQPPQRRRLWNLPPRALDMVLGVALPHDALRRVACQVLRAEPAAAGHELHAGLVTECRRRGPMAEALQSALDRRHAHALREAADHGSAEALAAWWQAQIARDEVPAALWAVLSHPRCNAVLEQRVLGEVQMLQFQAGQAARVELGRFAALIDENAVLGRALAAAQQRCTEMAAAHARERQAWLAETATLRGRLQAAQAGPEAPPAASRALVARRADRQSARIQALEQALAHAREQAAAAGLARPVTACAAAPAAPDAPAAAPPAPGPSPASAPEDLALDQRRVLCVGGRTGSVPVYRRLIEAQGARFLHHDGGEEDKLGGLDATLAAADLVICQAGCVSHNAYWRVKDHCKRTGKRCVFVETPSAAGLQRALSGIDSD